MKEKTPYRFTSITFKEWYEKVGKRVYQVLEFPNGKRIKRLTPYEDIPWIKPNLTQ